MNCKQETIERLNYIINHYKQNPPQNDKEQKQLKKAKRDLAKLQQLNLFSV
jgi:hypothetical protein